MSVRRRLTTLVGALALFLAVAPAVPAQRAVMDDAGRRVGLPPRVERVFAAGAPATILVYALAPDRLLGWVRALGPDERPWIPVPWADLPALGRLTGRAGTANVEVVLRARADLIVDYGAVTATYASLADRVQQQTGIPYLLIDGRLSATPRALRFLGDALGVPDRARALASYAERTLRETDERVARVPADRRPRVYYARGPDGLETGLPGSINVESLERLGARNVAEGMAGASLARVSLEQALTWNPDVIVTIDPAFDAVTGTDARWRGVRAVGEGRVHLAPILPFPWIDFPPSLNRIVGLRWLGRTLYPDLFPEDLRVEARDFYTLFYHRGPSDAQLDQLLPSTTRGSR